MKLIDTHTHVYLPEVNEHSGWDIEAQNAGVEALLLPNIDLASIDAMMSLCKAHPNWCFPMMGLHPCSVKENFEEVLHKMKSWFVNSKFYGVGEIGLDLYWDKTTLEMQKKAFRIQLGWAKELQLPVSIHSRDATEEALALVKSEWTPQIKGVFHCYTASSKWAFEIQELGFYLGIGGVVTFKNGGLDTWLKEFPLDHLVLETDAPYLAPVPFRGKTNKPSYLTYIAEKVGDIYGISADEVAKYTSENAKRMFFP